MASAVSGLIFELSWRLLVRIERGGMALCLHLRQLNSYFSLFWLGDVIFSGY